MVVCILQNCFLIPKIVNDIIADATRTDRTNVTPEKRKLFVESDVISGDLKDILARKSSVKFKGLVIISFNPYVYNRVVNILT